MAHALKRLLALVIALYPVLALGQVYTYFPPPGMTYSYTSSIAQATAAATTNTLGFYSFGGGNTLPFIKASPTSSYLTFCAGVPASGTGVNGNNCNTTMVLGKSGDWGVASSAALPTYFFQSSTTTQGFLGLMNDAAKGFSITVEPSTAGASTPFELMPSGLACPCDWFGNIGPVNAGHDMSNIALALSGNQAPGLNLIIGGYLDAAGYGHVAGNVDGFTWIQCDDPLFVFTCTLGDNTAGTDVTNIVGGSPANTRANNVPIVTGYTGTSASIGGSALLAGACSTGTVTVTGAASGMAVIATPNTYPGDGSEWAAYISAGNTVTVKVCAIVALTPTASTYNVRVIK